MPLFAMIGHDRPDGASIRADARPDHLAHLTALGDRLLLAGPMLDTGGAPTGSIVIAEFDDPVAAHAFFAADPYAAAGLFAAMTVTAWRKALPLVEPV